MKTEKTFQIPEENLPAFRDRIETLARKAKRLGCPAIEFTVGTPERVELRRPDGMGSVKVYANVFPVTVSGESPRVNGFEFVAKLSPAGDTGSNFVFAVLGSDEAKLPEKFRTAAMNCDHCHASRKRKDTFVLRNETTDEFSQVGRDCLKDFLGYNGSPEGLARSAEFLADLADAGEEAEHSESSGSGRLLSIDLVEFLAWVAAAIRVEGWVSRAKAREDETLTATSWVAWDLIFRSASSPEPKPEYLPTNSDRETAAKSLAWGLSLAAKADRSDFEHNVATLSKLGSVDYRTAGIAAAIVACFQREAARATAGTGSVHFRTVGEKFTIEAKVEENRTIPTGSTLLKVRTATGALLVTFASGTVPEFVKIGAVVTVSGTVREHREFRGVKETNVARARFALPGTAAPVADPAPAVEPVTTSSATGSEIPADLLF